jgi:hypothetical protein
LFWKCGKELAAKQQEKPVAFFLATDSYFAAEQAQDHLRNVQIFDGEVSIETT